MLSYLNWINEIFASSYEAEDTHNFFNKIKRNLLYTCLDPTSVFKPGVNNMELYTKIYNTSTLEDLNMYKPHEWNVIGKYVETITKWFNQLNPRERDLILENDAEYLHDLLIDYDKIKDKFDTRDYNGRPINFAIFKRFAHFTDIHTFFEVMSIFNINNNKTTKDNINSK